jgi:ketosteroid isomerase-like protein
VPADYQRMLEHLRDAYNARDPEAFVEVWSADCEWHPFLTAREEGDPGYHGHNGMRAWFEDTDEMYADLRVEFESFREVKGRLVVLGHMTAKGRGGAEVQSDVAWLFEPRDEKFRRGWAYPSHAEAEREAEALAPSGHRTP